MYITDSTQDESHFFDSTADSSPKPRRGAFMGSPDAEYIVQSKTSSAMIAMEDFLTSELMTEKGDKTTNVINRRYGRTYCIPQDKLPTFFSLYEMCRREHRLLHFCERQTNSEVTHSGIMVDFDVYQSTNERLTSRQLEDIIDIICDVVENTLDLRAANRTEFHLFVISRTEQTKCVKVIDGVSTTMYKDGFHVLIPELQVSAACKRYMMDVLAKELAADNTLCDAKLSIHEVVDQASARVPVHFLGSCKPGSHPYTLTLALNYTTSRKRGRGKLTAVDHLGITHEGLMKSVTPPKVINATYELSLVYSLPVIDGHPTWLNKQRIDYKPELAGDIERYSAVLTADTEYTVFTEAEKSVSVLTLNNADAGYVKRLLDMLDPSYATVYKKWFGVLCAVANASSTYKPLADWFSQKDPSKYTTDGFERAWNEATKIHDTPITMGSLEFWAKISSPLKYENAKNEHYLCILATHAYENQGCIEQSHNADVVVAMLGSKFITDDMGLRSQDHGWWEFVTSGQKMCRGEIYKWRYEPKPDNIYLFIASHLTKVYNVLGERIKKRQENTTDENTLKYLDITHRNLMKYKNRLGSDSFQNGIIRQCTYRFRERGFVKMLDTYPRIIGVGNGVLKLGTRCELITGYHEYRISKFTETKYIPWNPEDPLQIEILRAFHDIFPEEDVFFFMMCWMATNLDACPSANLLILLFGSGSNGKSFFLKMCHDCIGNQYAAAGKAALLTSPIEKGCDANSAQMQMKEKRLFYFEEFTKSEFLNDARLKSMVGQSWQSGRDLYGKQENFQCKCNPVAASNYELGITTTDHGTWRRIYYYKHKVRFSDKPDPGNPYEKKADPCMMRNMPGNPAYMSALLAILTHYYEIYLERYGGILESIPVPTIARETEEYRNSQDILNRFIVTNIVIAPAAPRCSIEKIALKYSEWCHAKFGSRLSGTEAESQIENSRLSPHLRLDSGTRFLVGHRLKDTDEELQTGESYIGACRAEHIKELKGEDAASLKSASKKPTKVLTE